MLSQVPQFLNDVCLSISYQTNEIKQDSNSWQTLCQVFSCCFYCKKNLDRSFFLPPIFFLRSEDLFKIIPAKKRAKLGKKEKNSERLGRQ